MAKLKASLALVLFSMIAAAGIAAWALGHGGGPDAPTFRDTGGEVASNAGPPVDESPPAEEPPPERPAEKSPLPIKVSEVHYHPPDSRPRSEFIEVLNPGAAEADLSGSAFTKGIRFTFPAGFRLPPGGHAVICEDLEGFRAAFGGAPRVAGVYEGRLDNAGEKISLQDAAARVVSDFHYLEGPPWPREADGGGRSLERVRIGGDPDDAGAWAAGAPTPGAANGSKGPGEALSVYQPRHSPGAPGPRDEVVIEARVHSAAEAPKVTLHYEARGVRRALPMSPRGAGARADADAEGRAQPGEGASPEAIGSSPRRFLASLRGPSSGTGSMRRTGRVVPRCALPRAPPFPTRRST